MRAFAQDGVRVLFLGGLGRSGTTLVERMVGELPEVAALGEVVHLWERALRDDERCGCGLAFSACEFWVEVGRKAFGGWDTLDVGEVLALKARVDRTRNVPRLALPLLGSGVRRDLERYLDLYERVYTAAAELSGAQVVVDSSKHASLAYCLRWSRRLDLRVLHVVRDSPAVAYSWTREVQRPEAVGAAGEGSLGELMPQYGTLRVVARWNVDNALFDLLGLLGTRVSLLRYEDLVTGPRASLARVAAFAGLPPGQLTALHGDRVVLHAGHTVAGNPMRFTSGELVLRCDDAWRDRYPAARRRAVTVLTLPLRLRFGYGRPGRAAAASRPAQRAA